jgi:hypothetical protein
MAGSFLVHRRGQIGCVRHLPVTNTSAPVDGAVKIVKGLDLYLKGVVVGSRARGDHEQDESNR